MGHLKQSSSVVGPRGLSEEAGSMSVLGYFLLCYQQMQSDLNLSFCKISVVIEEHHVTLLFFVYMTTSYELSLSCNRIRTIAAENRFGLGSGLLGLLYHCCRPLSGCLRCLLDLLPCSCQQPSPGNAIVDVVGALWLLFAETLRQHLDGSCTWEGWHFVAAQQQPLPCYTWAL